MSLELRSLLPYPNSCPGTSPHQQERDTKMAMLSFGGIDVSKDRLDVMVLPEEQCSSVPNDAAGWAKLVEQLRGFSISAVGIEASGGYERGAVRSLVAQLYAQARATAGRRPVGHRERKHPCACTCPLGNRPCSACASHHLESVSRASPTARASARPAQ